MKVEIGDATLYLGDCIDVMKQWPPCFKVSAVITDPPYPDWLAEEYCYYDGIIDFLNNLDCKQLVFWSTKVEFPLNYSARHIWDKKTGCGSEYEFLFERNGQKNYKMARFYFINSEVAAKFNGDVWTGHKSQKPIGLMRWCIEQAGNAETIFDPFMGSGTTGVAAIQMGKKFIGIEREPKYFDIACKRIEQASKQVDMFIEPPKQEQVSFL